MNTLQRLKAAILILDAYNTTVTALLLLSKVIYAQQVSVLELSVLTSVIVSLLLRMFIDVQGSSPVE